MGITESAFQMRTHHIPIRRYPGGDNLLVALVHQESTAFKARCHLIHALEPCGQALEIQEDRKEIEDR